MWGATLQDDGHSGRVALDEDGRFDGPPDHGTCQQGDTDAECRPALLRDAFQISRLNRGIDEHHLKVGFAQRAGQCQQRQRCAERRSVVGRIEQDHLAPRQQAASAGVLASLLASTAGLLEAIRFFSLLFSHISTG